MPVVFDCCLMGALRCLLFVVSCCILLSGVVCCPFLGDCCLSCAVRCLPFDRCCLLLVVGC